MRIAVGTDQTPLGGDAQAEIRAHPVAAELDRARLDLRLHDAGLELHRRDAERPVQIKERTIEVLRLA